MASVPTLSAPAESAPRALFELFSPIRAIIDGAEREVHGFEMRALDQADLALLDQFQGQPIALVRNLIARTCEIELEHVHQLQLADFTMLASEVLFQLETAIGEMGLPPRHYLGKPAELEDAA